MNVLSFAATRASNIEYVLSRRTGLLMIAIASALVYVTPPILDLVDGPGLRMVHPIARRARSGQISDS